MDIKNLTIEKYKVLIDKYGIDNVWKSICEELKSNDYKTFSDRCY